MKNKLMILLSLILILSITACAKEKDNNIETDSVSQVEDTEILEEDEVKVPEDEVVVEPEQEPDSAIESPSEDSSIKWPEDFMPPAPKLEGEIVVVKEEGSNKRFIELKNVSYDDAVKYVDFIKAAGFTQNTNEEANLNIVKYKGMDSDKNLIVFIWKKEITKIELIKIN